MPRTSKAWYGAEALWITVAGWSAAAKRKWGEAWVLMRDRTATPAEVLDYPLPDVHHGKLSRQLRVNSLPLFIKTVAKDLLLWWQSRLWRLSEDQPWYRSSVRFVWEQHDLFPGPGRALADKLGVPLIKYVHAPQVWEAAKWGVKRSVWGWFLERWVETPALKKADVVACVSQQVADKLMHMGVPKHKIVLSPMAVDPHLFYATSALNTLREKLNLDKKIVIGWTGSFRSFHGLDLLVKAFQMVHAKYPEAVLLLVGDGFERKPTEALVQELDLDEYVIFTGRQPFSKIPDYVSLFDIAVVSARSADGFHYSPLKLREYLVAGKAVLAPRAGEMPVMFKAGIHLNLYEAGNLPALAAALEELCEKPDLRHGMAQAGKQFALAASTWDYELDKVMDHLASRDIY